MEKAIPVKVAVRIRPLNEKEIGEGCQAAIEQVDIFEELEAKSSETTFKVGISFMELYSEQLFDLLSSKPRRENTIVELREDGNKGIKIPGMTEMEISSVAGTTALLEKASEGRVTAKNARSSRSHAIFTLTIEVRAKRDTKAMTVSKFHMMDLAGRDIIVPRVNRSGHPCLGCRVD